MKRFITLTFLALFALVLTACPGKKEAASETPASGNHSHGEHGHTH